jgi:hypothetical protein
MGAVYNRLAGMLFATKQHLHLRLKGVARPCGGSRRLQGVQVSPSCSLIEANILIT